MRKLWIFGLAIVLAVAAGCASGPKFDTVATSLPPVPGGKARIFIYRSSSLGAAIQPDVRLNGAVVGKAEPNGVFYVDRDPGNMEVITGSEVNRKLTFTAGAGETRYVKLGVGLGMHRLQNSSRAGVGRTGEKGHGRSCLHGNGRRAQIAFDSRVTHTPRALRDRRRFHAHGIAGAPKPRIASRIDHAHPHRVGCNLAGKAGAGHHSLAARRQHGHRRSPACGGTHHAPQHEHRAVQAQGRRQHGARAVQGDRRSPTSSPATRSSSSRR